MLQEKELGDLVQQIRVHKYSFFVYNNSMKRFKNIFYIFTPLVIGMLVGVIISKSNNYTSLNRPPLSPPKLVFPIAWTIIYLLIGIAFYIFKNTHNDTKSDNIIYYVQLFVNALWSIIFFNLKWYLVSVVWILGLIILIYVLLNIFKSKSIKSYYLFIPYLIWTVFATYLNIGIYILN